MNIKHEINCKTSTFNSNIRVRSPTPPVKPESNCRITLFYCYHHEYPKTYHRIINISGLLHKTVNLYYPNNVYNYKFLLHLSWNFTLHMAILHLSYLTWPQLITGAR